MNQSDLWQIAHKLEAYGIEADEITIKGKETMTVSFSARAHAIDDISQMCVDVGWTFHISHDPFLANEILRFQVHLDGRTTV